MPSSTALPTIREAHMSDAAALAELSRRTFTDTFAAGNTPDDLAMFLHATYGEVIQRQELASSHLMYFLAEVQGLPVAYVLLRHGKPSPFVDDPTAVEIQRLYVDRAFHGTGLAQRMMDECVRIATLRGAASLFLGVWEHNARALRFYAAQGFVPVGQQGFMLGNDPQTDLVMHRTLGDSRDILKASCAAR